MGECRAGVEYIVFAVDINEFRSIELTAVVQGDRRGILGDRRVVVLGIVAQILVVARFLILA